MSKPKRHPTLKAVLAMWYTRLSSSESKPCWRCGETSRYLVRLYQDAVTSLRLGHLHQLPRPLVDEMCWQKTLQEQSNKTYREYYRVTVCERCMSEGLDMLTLLDAYKLFSLLTLLDSNTSLVIFQTVASRGNKICCAVKPFRSLTEVVQTIQRYDDPRVALEFPPPTA